MCSEPPVCAQTARCGWPFFGCRASLECLFLRLICAAELYFSLPLVQRKAKLYVGW